MTRIAIFCDGTWNSPDIPEPTNVHKLQKAVRHMPGQGQVSVYFTGIGVDDRFDGKIKKLLNKYGGGAFGWGLDAKVKQVYEFIAKVYQPGDEIYLFGFSRGAFTARSVGGMLRKCGIVKDTSTEGINAAFKLYRRRGRRNHPDKLRVLRQRRELSPDFATSQADLDWRKKHRLGGTEDNSSLVKIAYVGVWDTVGARGVPAALLGPIAAIWNSQYKFHDMQLSSMVKSARHAVAVDEMRKFYRPSLWDNIDGLNGASKSDPLRAYQQVWFVGNHAVVGGSGDAQALAAFPLMWVLEGAGRLARDPNAILPPTRANATVTAPEVAPKKGFLSRWRSGPHHEHEMHPSVRERVMGRQDYRPKSLHRLF